MSILKNLVAEQLKLGHRDLSTSRHNTSVFVIPKQYGKYHLLQDLRAIDVQTEKNGISTNSSPTPQCLPRSHHVIMLDCFFQIPLASQCRDCFAFKVWEPNMYILVRRFQKTVLSLGIKKIVSPCIRFMLPKP